jgi:hypothetical protein
MSVLDDFPPVHLREDVEAFVKVLVRASISPRLPDDFKKVCGEFATKLKLLLKEDDETVDRKAMEIFDKLSVPGEKNGK